MRISSVKVKKTQSSKEALNQGFAFNFTDCEEGEIQLMLPTNSETLEKAIKFHGWEPLSEILTSHF